MPKRNSLTSKCSPQRGSYRAKWLMKTRRKPKVEKTHNEHYLEVYKNIYKPLCIKAFLKSPEGRNDAQLPPWHLSPTNQCCDWYTALKCNRKPRPWPAAAFLERYQGFQERADLCPGWLHPAHFPRLPIFLGKSRLIHSEPCTAQYMKHVYPRGCCSDRLKINEDFRIKGTM